MQCGQLTKFLPSFIGEVLDHVVEVVSQHRGVVAHLKTVNEGNEVQVLGEVLASAGTCEE